MFSGTGGALRYAVLAPWRCENEMARSEISQEVCGKSDLIHLFDYRALKESTF